MFATAFLVIFVAEWGDLTQVLTANFESRSQDKPDPDWAVTVNELGHASTTGSVESSWARSITLWIACGSIRKF